MASPFDSPTFAWRTSRGGLEREIFTLVARSAAPEQWAEWLQAPLEQAAAKGNLYLVDKLLGAGARVSACWKGVGGRTLLHAAAVGGNEGVMSSLLRAGAQQGVNVLTPPPLSRSPLYLATRCGNEAVARLLIHAGADVNFNDPFYEHTVLHESIRGGYDRLAKELMMSGANVKARDSGNRIPLHFAADNGLDGVVSTLLLRGVDIDAVDCSGDSALMWGSAATEGGPHLVVETLLAAGADPNIRPTVSPKLSALDWAAFAGHSAAIKALIVSGVDVNARDSDDGCAALHRAAIADKAESVDALIAAGADTELKSSIATTPLSVAAKFGNSRALLALLQHGAIPDARDSKEQTPLHLACYFQPEGLKEVVELLLRWDADQTALDQDGCTPADSLSVVDDHGNCSEEDVERVRLLLARAPGDRAWRRRCWLVMLRARVSQSRCASCDSGLERGQHPTANADDGSGEGRKVARSECAAGVTPGRGGQPDDSSGQCVGAEAGDLVGVVALLAKLESEGVFRTIMRYL